MLGWGKRRHIAARNGEVQMHPFPHMTIDQPLPGATLTKILSTWPQREAMSHEKAHDRWYLNLLLGPNWIRDAVEPVLARIAETLRPYYAARYSDPIVLRPTLLMLHEAGEGFVEHAAHTHFIHNPEYAFTALIYLDDGGCRSRGTTLYAVPWKPTAESLMDSVSGRNHAKTAPATSIPFVPNTALAFVDSAVSWHGSTPFDTVPVRSTRKMLLCHMGVHPDCITHPVTQAKMEGAMSVWGGRPRKFSWRGRTNIPPEIRRWFDREAKVLSGWHHAAS